MENELLQLFQVMSMLWADRPIADKPENWADVLFLHARSFNGDNDGLPTLASILVRESSRGVIVINGGNGDGVEPGIKAWPGCEYYKKELESLIDPVLGCKVMVAKPGRHTFEEAMAFSELAEEFGWKRAIVIAQPFQLLRIMLTHLKVMEIRNYPIKVHAVAPKFVDWLKVTNANQGKPGVPRFDQIEAELGRVPTYQKQGNLATVVDLVEFLLRGREAI